MSDLIDRQMAIDALSAILDNPNHAEFLYGDEICKTLQDLPSAERRGRWLYKSELYSYCGRPFYPKICSVCNGVFEYTTNYCPNCGARMDGEEE